MSAVAGSLVWWWLCCQASTTAQFAAAVWLLAGSGVVLLHPRLLLAGRGAAHPSSPALLAHVCVCCVCECEHAGQWPWAWLMCAAHLVFAVRGPRQAAGGGRPARVPCSCGKSLLLGLRPPGRCGGPGWKKMRRKPGCVCGVGAVGCAGLGGLGSSGVHVCMVCCMALWMQARPGAARA